MSDIIGAMVKGKNPGTGQYEIVGNIVDGKFGPQIELKVGPALRAMLTSQEDGRRVWLSITQRRKDGAPAKAAPSIEAVLDDEIPF